MKRRYKILLALAAVLVLGYAVLLPHGGYRRKVEAYKKQLIAKGEKLTMVELAPPRSTNASNGAMALTNAMEGYRLPSDYPSMMKIIAPGVAMIGHSNVNVIQMASYRSNVAKAAELRGILQAQTLDFNLDYSKGSELSLLHFIKLKVAGTLLSLTATQALHEKDYSEAWQDLLAAADLIRLYTNESFMISDLVRIATARVAMAATWEALQQSQWKDAQLAELQARWEAVDLFKTPETVMAMERAWGIDDLGKARRKENAEGVFYLEGLTGSSTESEGGFLSGLWGKMKELYNRYPRFWAWKSSWSYEEELYYLQLTSEAKETARRIIATGASVPAIKEFKQQMTNIAQLHPAREKHFRGGLFQENDVFETTLMKTVNAETVRRLFVTAIALQRYELERHSYPSNLTELVPGYLRQVPVDLMDGKPLRYQLKTDGSYVLYSVGENGEDDGGNPSPTDASASKDWLRGRDIVWPRAATPKEVEDYDRRQAKATNASAK